METLYCIIYHVFVKAVIPVFIVNLCFYEMAMIFGDKNDIICFFLSGKLMFPR